MTDIQTILSCEFWHKEMFELERPSLQTRFTDEETEGLGSEKFCSR